MVEQTNLYANQNNDTSFSVSKEEMKVYIAILIISGYNKLPSKRNYWSHGNDFRNSAIYNVMRRNKFDEIMSYLHFNSNENFDSDDKYWKLRPLIEHLQKKIMDHFVPSQNVCHDESMIQYFGKHGCKQAIRNKPIRFGYKVWSQCSKSGYLIAFDLYQGKTFKGDEQVKKTFGKCSATALNLLGKYNEAKKNLPYIQYCDNLFTSLPLLAELKIRG